MASKGALELNIRIMGQLDKSFTAAMNSTNSALGSVTKTVGALGKAGLALTGALTAATTAAIASTTKAAQEFEAQMASVTKYVSGIADETGKIDTEKYDEMSDIILRLSTQVPYTAEELTKLAAAAGQSGYSFEQIAKLDKDGSVTGFLKDVAMAGSALDISAEQAGDWAAKWEVALNMTHDEIMDLFDQINYLGAHNATTAAEIAEVVNDTASMGQVAGMSADATAALATAMLSMGVNGSRAATSINRIYTTLSLGAGATKAQKDAWEELGFTATGVARQMQTDAAGTMLDVFNAIGNADADRQLYYLKTLFGQWAVQGSAKLTGNLSAYADALEAVNDQSKWQGSMEREYLIKATTGDSIDTMFQSSINRFQVTMGNAFLPIKKELALVGIDFMNGITDAIPDLTDLANNIMPYIQKAAEGIGTAAQNIGKFIGDIFSIISNHGGEVATLAGTLVSVFGLMSAAPAIGGLFSGGSTGIISTLTGGGNGSRKGGGLLSGIGGTFKAAQLGAQIANNEGGKSWQNTLLGGILGAQNAGALGKARSGRGMSRAVGNLTGLITNAQGPTGSGLLGVIGSAISKNPVGAYFANVGGSLKNLANTNLVQGALGLAKAVPGKAAGLASSAGTYITSLFGQSNNAAIGSGGGVLSKIISGAGGFASGAAGKVGGIASGIAGKAGSLASSAGSFLAPIASGAMGGAKSVFQFLGAGANVIGTAASPLMSIGGVFTSMLGTFGPVIAGIGGVIAVVSMLGDNMEGIQLAIRNAFGVKGLHIFNTFKDTVVGIGEKVQAVFSPEGLAGIKEAITNTFGEGAGNAFGMMIPLIETVSGIFGQIVDLGVNHMKPLFEEIGSFLINDLFPKIMPLLTTVVGIVGTTLVNAVKVVIDVAGTVLPIVEPIITKIIGLIQGIANVATNVINFIIRGLNKIHVSVPDGVPFVGGMEFGFNIQEIGGFGGNSTGYTLTQQDMGHDISIPTFGNGGITSGLAFAGEDGPETVIPHDPARRSRALGLWLQTGKILGVGGLANGGFAGGAREWGLSMLTGLALGTDAGAIFTKGVEFANAAANVLQATGIGGAKAQRFIADARQAGGMRRELGYIASADAFMPSRGGRGIPDLSGAGHYGQYEDNGGQYVFAPNITISGNADAGDIKRQMNDLYEQFCAFMDKYERERRRTRYA